MPLTFTPGGLPASVPKLEIELATGPADAAVGRMAIRWGKHELAAPMRLERAAPADVIEDKK